MSAGGSEARRACVRVLLLRMLTLMIRNLYIRKDVGGGMVASGDAETGAVWTSDI